MRLELATAEYIGARAQQQDLATAVPLKSGALLVLADGLGGHESGAEASRIVVDTFREAAGNGSFDAPESRRQALRDTVERANTRIGAGVDPAHGHRGMASTAVAAVVANGELSWVSVGDSHLYVWRGGRLAKLNEDHSQAGLMVKSGQYRPNDPEVLAVRSVLVSALTGRKLEIVDLPVRAFKVEAGDVLMLASDGLNTLPDEEIGRIVADRHGEGAVRLSTVLLETVRSRRVERQDNTTVAVARVLETVVWSARDDAGSQRTVTHQVTVPKDLEATEARTERAPQIDESAMALEAAAPAAAVEKAVAPSAASAAAAFPEQPRAEPHADGKAEARKPPAAHLPTRAEHPPKAPPRPPAEASPRATAAARPAEARSVRPPQPEIGSAAASPDALHDHIPSMAHRRSMLRMLVLVLLIWLAFGLAAVASVAALKPEWLPDWMQSYLPRTDTAAPSIPPAKRPADVPPAAPDASTKGKEPVAETPVKTLPAEPVKEPTDNAAPTAGPAPVAAPVVRGATPAPAATAPDVQKARASESAGSPPADSNAPASDAATTATGAAPAEAQLDQPVKEVPVPPRPQQQQRRPQQK
ncbi:MAG: protein phosphatase 2C domain-containing protein [Hyphomicrobiaceae bacterium]|nr:protein phosphatase 2C domain-containing protein [Hyphomicrobiaceae bacterium]